MNILLTSIGTATSIGIIKNLRKYRSDWRIVGVDINDYGYTAGSLLVDTFYQVPIANANIYEKEIMQIIIDERIEYFWPINDVEIEVASRWKKISFACITPSNDVLKLIGDKLRCTEIVSKIGIDCPPIVDIGYGGKCIIREKHGVGSKGIRFSESIYKEKVKNSEFIQKYIAGQEYTVDILADQVGNPLFIVPRARLEVKVGVSTKAKIALLPDLIELVKKIMNVITLPGFSNMQFIRSMDGRYYFIEINPRVGGCSSASFLAAPKMFVCFLEMIEDNKKTNGTKKSITFNQEVRWGSVVTRFYEEILYET